MNKAFKMGFRLGQSKEAAVSRVGRIAAEHGVGPGQLTGRAARIVRGGSPPTATRTRAPTQAPPGALKSQDELLRRFARTGGIRDVRIPSR